LDLWVLVVLAVDFHAELLSNVEDIRCHVFDIDGFNELCLWQRVDVVDEKVNVLDQTHFDEHLVTDVKGVALLKGADEEGTKIHHYFRSAAEADVFDAYARINRQKRRHTALDKDDESLVVFRGPCMILLHTAWVLEKWNARSHQNHNVVLVVSCRQNALVQENSNVGHVSDMNVLDFLFVDILHNIVHVLVYRDVTVQRQQGEYLVACAGVTFPDHVLERFDFAYNRLFAHCCFALFPPLVCVFIEILVFDKARLHVVLDAVFCIFKLSYICDMLADFLLHAEKRREKLKIQNLHTQEAH